MTQVSQIMLALQIAVFTFFLGATAQAEAPCEDRVCITDRERGGAIDLVAVNSTYATISLLLNLELENLDSDGGLEQRFVLEPKSTRQITSLETVKPGDAWRYNYEYYWRLGDYTTTHSDSAEYLLPVAPGSKVFITQGCNGMLSHVGKRRFATDIDLPVGTPVHAARAGTVVYTKDYSIIGGSSEVFRDDANEILVQHDDRTIAMYLHLKHKGVEVKLGERIAAGQRIGLSGNTGWSTGPHLHFEVWKPDAQMRMDSIAVSFDTTAGPVRCPKERYLTARRR